MVQIRLKNSQLGVRRINKSYNSIMTMLINKEQDMYKTTNNTKAIKYKHSKDQNYNFKTTSGSSNSKLFSTSSRKNLETAGYKHIKEPKSFKKSEVTLYSNKSGEREVKRELEEFLKTSRASRNYQSHNYNAHMHKTHR